MCDCVEAESQRQGKGRRTDGKWIMMACVWYVCICVCVCMCVYSISAHGMLLYGGQGASLNVSVCVCVQKWEGVAILKCTCVFIGLGGIISMGVVCVCTYCQCINIQYRATVVCTYVKYPVFALNSLYLCSSLFPFACSFLHIWCPTTWSNRILFRPSDMTCCPVTGEALSLLCATHFL